MRRLAAIWLLMTACVVPDRLYLPVPPVPSSGRSLVLAVTGPTFTRYFAYALPREGPLDPPLLDVEGLAFEAAVFDAVLEDLTLTEGEVRSRAAGTESLTGFSSAYAAERGRRGLTSWRMVSDLGDALSAFRLPPTSPGSTACAPLDYSVVAVPTEARVLFAEPVRPGEVLVVDELGAAFVVTRTEARRVVVDPPGTRITAASHAPETVWFGYEINQGRTALGRGRVDPDRVSINLVSTATDTPIRALGRDVRRNRFIALTGRKTMVEYGSQGFVRLGDLDGFAHRGYLAQGDDGRWLGTFAEGTWALQLDGSETRAVFPETLANTVARSEAGGLVVGTEGGAIDRLVEDELSPVARLPGLGIRSLAPYARGFVVGVDGGQVALVEDGEVCPPEPVLGALSRPGVFRGLETTVAVHVNSGDERGFRPAPLAFIDLENR